MDSVGFDSARLGSVPFRSVRFSSVRFGSVGFRSVGFNEPGIKEAKERWTDGIRAFGSWLPAHHSPHRVAEVLKEQQAVLFQQTPLRKAACGWGAHDGHVRV